MPEFKTNAELSDQAIATGLSLTLARVQQPAMLPVEEPSSEPVTQEPIEPPKPQPEPKSEPVPENIAEKKSEPVVSSHTPTNRKVAKSQEPITPPKPFKPVESKAPAPEPAPAVSANAESDSPGEEAISEQAAEASHIDAMKVWQAELQQRINRNRHYPRQALRRGLEDNVQIKAVIRPDGTLDSVEVLSGHKSFKASSLKTLRKSLPHPPPEGTKDTFTIVFTIKYRIE